MASWMRLVMVIELLRQTHIADDDATTCMCFASNQPQKGHLNIGGRAPCVLDIRSYISLNDEIQMAQNACASTPPPPRGFGGSPPQICTTTRDALCGLSLLLPRSYLYKVDFRRWCGPTAFWRQASRVIQQRSTGVVASQQRIARAWSRSAAPLLSGWCSRVSAYAMKKKRMCVRTLYFELAIRGAMDLLSYGYVYLNQHCTHTHTYLSGRLGDMRAVGLAGTTCIGPTGRPKPHTPHKWHLIRAPAANWSLQKCVSGNV